MLFICHSVYHIFVSCLKTLHDKVNADILITDNVPDAGYYQKQLEESGIFQNVHIVRHHEVFGRKTKSSYHLALFYQLLRRKFVKHTLGYLCEYDDVYIYNDYTAIGAFLWIHKCPVHLLEDGYSVYSTYNMYARRRRNMPMKKFFYYVFNIPYTLAQAPNCIDIEVDNDMALMTPLIMPIRVQSRHELANKLSAEDQKRILCTFNIQIDTSVGKKALLLTTPLVEAYMAKTFEEQVDFFHNAILHYQQEYHLYIKPHPRDNADYSTLLSERVSLIDKKFPIEILSFVPEVRFDIVLTHSSTATNGLTFCDRIVNIR